MNPQRKKIRTEFKISLDGELLVQKTIENWSDEISNFERNLIIYCSFIEKLREGKLPIGQIYSDIREDLFLVLNISLSINTIIRKFRRLI